MTPVCLAARREIIAPGAFSEYFEEVARLGPPDPTDKEWASQFLATAEWYGLEIDLESVPFIR